MEVQSLPSVMHVSAQIALSSLKVIGSNLVLLLFSQSLAQPCGKLRSPGSDRDSEYTGE